MLQLTCCQGRSQIKRHRPIESGNACAIFESFDAHAPIAGMRGRMKISIIYKRLYFKVDAGRGRAVNNAVLHKRRILAVLHPYALFDACRSGQECPDRNRSIQPETLYREISLRRDGSAGPAVSRKLIRFPTDRSDRIKSANEKFPLAGRDKSGYQKPVIAPRRRTYNGARCKSSNPICHQPFALFCCQEVVANIGAKGNHSSRRDLGFLIFRDSQRTGWLGRPKFSRCCHFPEAYSPLCSSNFATRPVQPVWWFAPMPAPLSP